MVISPIVVISMRTCSARNFFFFFLLVSFVLTSISLPKKRKTPNRQKTIDETGRDNFIISQISLEFCIIIGVISDPWLIYLCVDLLRMIFFFSPFQTNLWPCFKFFCKQRPVIDFLPIGIIKTTEGCLPAGKLCAQKQEEQSHGLIGKHVCTCVCVVWQVNLPKNPY